MAPGFLLDSNATGQSHRDQIFTNGIQSVAPSLDFIQVSDFKCIEQRYDWVLKAASSGKPAGF